MENGGTMSGRPLCCLRIAAVLVLTVPAFAFSSPPRPLFGLIPGFSGLPKINDRSQASHKSPEETPEGSKADGSLRISGSLAGEGRWRNIGDVPMSDLYLRIVEVALETQPADWVSAIVVLNSEWIGDPLNGGDGTVVVDEAHVDLSLPRLPFYFVLGKRTQPFGVFETNFITDPLTQDAYETKTVGLTAGLNAPLGSDLSLTLYKGRVLSEHLYASGLFDAGVPTPPLPAASRVDSWILSGTVNPIPDAWTVFASCSSEPGAGRRMVTLGFGTQLVVPGLEHLRIGVESMKALSRENAPGLARSFRESTLSLSVSYQIVLRQGGRNRGVNYLARKSRRIARPTQISVRYETFDDGSRASALGSWSVRGRASVGGRYTFYEKGELLAALMFEFGRQSARISPAFAGHAPSGYDAYFRLRLDF